MCLGRPTRTNIVDCGSESQIYTCKRAVGHYKLTPTGMSRVSSCLSEYIDYNEPGNNHISLLWMGFITSLFSSVGSCYHV